MLFVVLVVFGFYFVFSGGGDNDDDDSPAEEDAAEFGVGEDRARAENLRYCHRALPPAGEPLRYGVLRPALRDYVDVHVALPRPPPERRRRVAAVRPGGRGVGVAGAPDEGVRQEASRVGGPLAEKPKGLKKINKKEKENIIFLILKNGFTAVNFGVLAGIPFLVGYFTAVNS